MRKDNVLVTGEIYHVYTKSIAKYKIFQGRGEVDRVKMLLRYYTDDNPDRKFSNYEKLKNINDNNIGIKKTHKDPAGNIKIVRILAYCVMPTHLHLILQQLKDRGISAFMNKVLNSYTRYFNTKVQRKGPLWESRFGRARVDADEQLYHLTRYLHLNPVTEHLADSPEKWYGSSYKEYIGEEKGSKICKFDDMLDIDPIIYVKFVNDNTEYQRELAVIKKTIV